MVCMVDLDGEPCRVRFTDGAGGPFFQKIQKTALSAAHVALLCFSPDKPETLQHVKDRWLPLFWSMNSEAPWLLVSLSSDKRERKKAAGELTGMVPQEEAESLAHRLGAWAYVESSAFFPETVQLVVEEALAAGTEFYRLQWQLPPPSEEVLDSHGYRTAEQLMTRPPVDRPWTAAPAAGEHELWLPHEKLNVKDDPTPATEEQVRQGLSQLGDTGLRQHAYLRCDLAGLSLTSLVAIRPWVHLQFLNVSRNQLRNLEPLGALRSLLHLNASHNLLIRSQNFTAPDALETCDMSYNMIAEVGDWKVHRYLRELNLRGNYITKIGTGLRGNMELRMLDLSENFIAFLENLDSLELRTLNCAQNCLSSLEGVQTLSKLQSLDVRHNMITTVGALHAEDIPRLRKLRCSENRISQMRDLDQLAAFPFLSDLYLEPNPVSQLPQFRAQVLHRLPRLRSLDAQQVTAEERVKTDLIFGADIETRKEIFEQLLPEETFVDRRLTTAELIAEMEIQQFGRNGDAGPYGSDSYDTNFAKQGHRTRLQQIKFRQRVEQARRGGEPEGVADFANFSAPYLHPVISDEDMPELLEAVAEGGVEELLLGAAQLSVESVRSLVAFMRDSPCRLRHVDLAGCTAVASLGVELVNTFPFEKGCSLETENCGLAETNSERLRNHTAEAEQALAGSVEERKRSTERVAAYRQAEEAFEDAASEFCARDAPPPPPPPLCHPLKWRKGVDKVAEKAFKDFLQSNPQGLVESNGGWTIKGKDKRSVDIRQDEYSALCGGLDSMLLEFSGSAEPGQGRPLPEAFLAAFGSEAEVHQDPNLLGFMLWEGVTPSNAKAGPIRKRREDWEAAWRTEQERYQKLSDQATAEYDSAGAPFQASGQIIAHFSHLSQPPSECSLKPASHFGLQKVSEKSPPPQEGQDLHSALADGLVAIDNVIGSGIGVDSVRLDLRNLTMEPILIAVRRGTVFQQQDWVHRQNLLLSVDHVLELAPGGTTTKFMHAYGMNSSCASPNGNAMDLTDFYVDKDAMLASQALVWDHFDRILTSK
eukprot:TRINITY_DN35297_c2_g1_i1.p1 TRINITY_DN35297_c2_g1~~TRINITY_DN35297_c2_g1_i1.p1  ORF type:complete len:1124 (+),score=267.55 TRINITY_DN35297_c2_g1_i1:243-3374(+)